MIIKDITIKNFRSYYGVNHFSLSKGLTLIIGDNGDGKTTFFEALEWLFDTSIENKKLSHISEKRKSELEISESDEVSVCITFEHDGEKEIDSMNLYIRDGEFITFLGPSGCGKTMTLRIIGGFETADEGQLYFDGVEIYGSCYVCKGFVRGV